MNSVGVSQTSRLSKQNSGFSFRTARDFHSETIAKQSLDLKSFINELSNVKESQCLFKNRKNNNDIKLSDCKILKILRTDEYGRVLLI